jgi:hypothetical protein
MTFLILLIIVIKTNIKTEGIKLNTHAMTFLILLIIVMKTNIKTEDIAQGEFNVLIAPNMAI